MDTNIPSQPSQPTDPNSHPQNYAWVAYLFGWISGLIIFLTTKDKAAKFHGAQSFILFGGLHVFWWIISGFLFTTFAFGTGFGAFFGLGAVFSLLQLAVAVLWVFLMVKAYQGEQFKLPVIGDLAEKWASK